MASISHINDKYEIAKETAYGTLPSPFTVLDFGHIQTITTTVNENTEKVYSVNGGHTANTFEDGISYVSGTMESFVTKASLPNILEAFFGSRADATDYTVTSDPSSADSYAMKFQFDTTQTLQLLGVVFTTINIQVAKDDRYTVSMDFIAKEWSKATETLTVTPTSDDTFEFLDCSMTWDGDSFVTTNFNLTGSWNIDDTEGRGIESVSAGERRYIQRVIRHSLDISGSFEFEIDDNFAELIPTEARTNKALVFTASRGTDNDHLITLSNCRTNTEEIEFNVDNSTRVISADFEALDATCTGDL